MDAPTGAPVKRRPPRLASTDRTVSLAIDNYAPPPLTISGMLNTRLHTTADLQMVSPVLLQPLSADATHNRAKLFYMGRSTNSIGYDDYHPHYGARKPAIRRSDTLGVHSFADGGSGGLYEMDAAVVGTSFRNDISPSMMAKRTASMRHSTVRPNELKSTVGVDNKTAAERRSCKMHRSFNDPKRKPQTEHPRKEVHIETIKCHSLGDEADGILDVPRKLSPKFNSANVSLEKDIYRSHSNSRNQLPAVEDDPDAIESIGRMQHSSHSLEEKQYNFQRGSKYTHSFYLNPNSAAGEDFPIVTYSPRPVQDRRQFSASMRSRPYRESLATTKKSKSFVGESHRVFERSPVAGHRRDSKAFASVDDAKRSPRLSSGNNLLTPDSIVAMGDSRKSPNMDISELDYDEIIRLYQENRRKSSAAPIPGSDKKKVKKKSIDLNSETDVTDEFLRKRKKIVCIIVTVFLGLVFASVFVVVFTLTHSIDAQVHNQTKKVYTFSRDRDMPIHYNSVRQENERLMQESFNRAKYARNYTDAVPLAAGEEIP